MRLPYIARCNDTLPQHGLRFGSPRPYAEPNCAPAHTVSAGDFSPGPSRATLGMRFEHKLGSGAELSNRVGRKSVAPGWDFAKRAHSSGRARPGGAGQKYNKRVHPKDGAYERW